MEYPEQFLRQFKHDYYKHGKFNLDVQVFHLARLAEFYHDKYKVTKDWTDCLKAHSLYNSISTRRPHMIGWKERVFEIQNEYYGNKFSLTFEQQQELTAGLKRELETIREESRHEIISTDDYVHTMGDTDIENPHFRTLYDKMREISINCSRKMTAFAGKIIKESVNITTPTSPPCDFVAVAIGSLARGEATPYSDLEYLFLVDEKSPDSENYFERLAVTSYFQITNLGETKLSYMAIRELQGWFDDRSMNGFRIDGLTEQAGNIPTGNGSSRQLNHFIVTPHELAARFQTILDNPDEKEAMRGDLTAMLTYTSPIFSQQIEGRDLAGDFQKSMRNMIHNQLRHEVNIKMLDADVRKFKFEPSVSLIQGGFGVDVKRELYRLPSLLLHDITIVNQIFRPTSWESLEYHEGLISTELYNELQFLLAAATYMRLSAYLFHNSQDERISVAPALRDNNNINNLNQSGNSQRRWFVPEKLIYTISIKMTLLMRILTGVNVSCLAALEIDSDDTWSRITILHYLGRYRESLTVMKQLYGEDICETLCSATLSLPPGASLYEMLVIAAGDLHSSKEYQSALKIYEHILTLYPNGVHRRSQIAECYEKTGQHNKAMDIIESLKVDQPEAAHPFIYRLYLRMKEYDKAEHSLVQGLDYEHSCLLAPEPQYDYHGNQIQAGADNSHSTENLFGVIAAKCTPEERLSCVTNISAGVIHYLASLGSIYYNKEQYTLAEAYLRKTQQFVWDLYGQGAAISIVGNVSLWLGQSYHELGRYSEALDNLKLALSVFRQVLGGDHSSLLKISPISQAIAMIFDAMGAYNEAKVILKQALGFFKKQPFPVQNGIIPDILHHLGIAYTKTSQFSDALGYYEQALTMHEESSHGVQTIDTARIFFNLARTYRDMKQYNRAEGCYKQSLFIYRGLSQGTYSEAIAGVLDEIRDIYWHMGRYCESADYDDQAKAMRNQL